MDPTMLLDPMVNAPRSVPGQEPVPVLLYCPDEERWQAGVWLDGAWRQQGHPEHILHLTHWLPAGDRVVVERASGDGSD